MLLRVRMILKMLWFAKEEQIKELLELGVGKGKIAEKLEVSRPTLNRFLEYKNIE